VARAFVVDGDLRNSRCRDLVRPLIVARASAGEIKVAALRQGMRTLRTDGWNKVLDGTTTMEEVLRVSEEDEALSEG